MQPAFSPEELEPVLSDEKTKGNPYLKKGNSGSQYGGLVRASDRFTGWINSGETKRVRARIPYQSTECTERNRCFRYQASRGIEITQEDTMRIAGFGDLRVVGGVRTRPRGPAVNVAIHEWNQARQNRERTHKERRSFVIVVTFECRDDGKSEPKPGTNDAVQRGLGERIEEQRNTGTRGKRGTQAARAQSGRRGGTGAEAGRKNRDGDEIWMAREQVGRTTVRGKGDTRDDGMMKRRTGEQRRPEPRRKLNNRPYRDDTQRDTKIARAAHPTHALA